MNRRPPNTEPDAPMPAQDLWFLGGVALAVITFLCVSMGSEAWPFTGMAAAFSIGVSKGLPEDCQ